MVKEVETLIGRKFKKRFYPHFIQEENFMVERNQMESEVNKEKMILAEGSKTNQLEYSNEDLLVFTYDQNLDSVIEYKFHNKHTYKFRLSSIKGERDLRREITHGIQEDNIENIHIILNYER